MNPIRIFLVFGSHLLALATAVYSIRNDGVQVQVLLYAFIFDYMLRLWSIALLQAEMTSRDPSWIGVIAPLISRKPRKHEVSAPVREGENGPPARLGTYLFAMTLLGALAFVLANVGADREIHVDAIDVVKDLSWAVVIGALYWINSLLGKAIVMDPRLSLVQNLGYNTREVTVLALSVLTAGLVVVYRQNAHLEPSAWTVMGPLVVWRFIHDLWAGLDALPQPEPEA